MATISEMAKSAGKFLVRDKAKDILLLADDAPDWFTAVCREAHNSGSMLPDDWRYEFIQDALNALEDDTDATPDVDSLYPYTADRLKWLASHLDRPAYCDEAMSEMGLTFTSTLDLIGWGMYMELSEVYNQVRNALEVASETLEVSE